MDPTPLMRARKLLAIIDPANNASEGERDNARRALEHLMRTGNFTMEDIAGHAERQVREMVFPSRSHLIMAAQILRWMRGTNIVPMKSFKRGTRTAPNKRYTYRYVIEVEIGAAEYIEWGRAYEHYLPAFKEGLKACDRAIQFAKKDKEAFHDGFIARHRIYAPDTAPAESLTPEDIERIRRAMQRSGGTTLPPRGQRQIDGAAPTLALPQA